MDKNTGRTTLWVFFIIITDTMISWRLLKLKLQLKYHFPTSLYVACFVFMLTLSTFKNVWTVLEDSDVRSEFSKTIYKRVKTYGRYQPWWYLISFHDHFHGGFSMSVNCNSGILRILIILIKYFSTNSCIYTSKGVVLFYEYMYL